MRFPLSAYERKLRSGAVKAGLSRFHAAYVHQNPARDACSMPGICRNSLMPGREEAKTFLLEVCMGSDNSNIRGGAAVLRDLVAYGKGSVGSRTVIDRKVGTVTVFAFDEGQGLSEHTAPYDALVYIIEGEADIVVSRTSNRVREGEMIVLPGNEPHSLRAVTKFKMMLVMIRE